MKVHIIYGSVVVILLCIVAILIWHLQGYSLMYRRNVDYCSEFAFAYGYAFGANKNISEDNCNYHHRLSTTSYNNGTLEVEIWPAKNQWLIFHPPDLDNRSGVRMDCFIIEK